MADTFWNILEAEFGFEIPNVIKISFGLCGFANPLSFKAITDIQINEVEKFIREDMYDYLKRKTAEEINQIDQSTLTNAEDVLITQEQLVQHFGQIYALQPDKFRFQSGDRLTIEQMVNHVKNLTDEKRSKLFKINHKSKPKKKSSKSTFNCFGSDTVADLKHKLIEQIIQCMKSYGVDRFCDVDLNCAVLEENVVLYNEGDAGMFCTVRCIVCDFVNKKKKHKPKRIYYDYNRNNPRWVMSNFGSHLKTHGLVRQVVNTNLNLNANINYEFDLNAFNKPSVIEIPDSNDSCEILEEVAHSETEHSTDNDGEHGTNDHSKEDENVNDMHTQLSQQITLMVPTTLTKGTREDMEFILDNVQYTLTVAKTKADGNCLFSALAHQLFRKKIGTKTEKIAVEKLREIVVNHILNPNNFPRFIHQLKGRVYEMKKKTQISDMESECNSFVQSILSQSGTWGGAETIQAVSEIHEVNVIIFNEMGPCYTLGNANYKYNRSVCIAYRLSEQKDGLRDHYDSVCDIESSALYKAAQELESK